MSRYFTREHEWVEIEGDVGTVGISDYAQSQLGDITFVELPAVGAQFAQGDAAAVVDSVKAASDIFVPVSGSVTETNEALEDEPELVNTRRRCRRLAVSHQAGGSERVIGPDG